MPSRVAAVLPLFNEGPAAAELVRRMPGCVGATFVVDDGSTDDGADQAEAAGATVIRFGRNRGIGAAIRAGLDAARAAGCDIAVVMAGNGKDRPEEIPNLLAALEADDGYDNIQGPRFRPSGATVNLPPS